MRSTLRHPKTGEELAWVSFLRKNGSVRYVAPVLGAAPDDSDDDPDSGEGDPDDTSDSGGDGGDDTDPEDASGDKGKDDKDAALEAQREKTRLADKRASAAEAELRKLKLKDASELEKANARVAELEEELTGLREQSQSLTLNQALLSHPSLGASAWNDPSDVLAALAKAVANEDVKLEDGEVKGLDPWLKGLAKSKSYWLKPKDEDEEEEPAPTGSPVGSGRKKTSSKLTEDELRRRFPALR